MVELVKYYSLILSNPALKSIFIAIISIIAAKVVDIIFTIIFKRLVSKTETDLDDKDLDRIKFLIDEMSKKHKQQKEFLTEFTNFIKNRKIN